MKTIFHIVCEPKRKELILSKFESCSEFSFYVEATNEGTCLPMNLETYKDQMKTIFVLVAEVA